MTLLTKVAVVGVSAEPPKLAATPIDLRAGIRRMAAWVKSRRPATSVRFSGIEVRHKPPIGSE